jgi:hypothetical protein
MAKGIRRLSRLVVFGALCAVAYLFASALANRAAQTPDAQTQLLAVAQSELDLGRLYETTGLRPPSGWTVEIVPSDTDSKKMHAIIRSQGPLPARKVADRILFHPIGHDEQRCPSKSLSILGYIVEDVRASPNEIQLGRRDCGTNVEEAIRLDSLTGRSFSVIEIKPSGNVAVTQLPTVATESTYVLRVRIDAPGEQALGVKFVIRDQDGTQQELNVPVRYVGVEP